MSKQDEEVKNKRKKEDQEELPEDGFSVHSASFNSFDFLTPSITSTTVDLPVPNHSPLSHEEQGEEDDEEEEEENKEELKEAKVLWRHLDNQAAASRVGSAIALSRTQREHDDKVVGTDTREDIQDDELPLIGKNLLGKTPKFNLKNERLVRLTRKNYDLEKLIYLEDDYLTYYFNIIQFDTSIDIIENYREYDEFISKLIQRGSKNFPRLLTREERLPEGVYLHGEPFEDFTPEFELIIEEINTKIPDYKFDSVGISIEGEDKLSYIHIKYIKEDQRKAFFIDIHVAHRDTYDAKEAFGQLQHIPQELEKCAGLELVNMEKMNLNNFREPRYRSNNFSFEVFGFIHKSSALVFRKYMEKTEELFKLVEPNVIYLITGHRQSDADSKISWRSNHSRRSSLKSGSGDELPTEEDKEKNNRKLLSLSHRNITKNTLKTELEEQGSKEVKISKDIRDAIININDFIKMADKDAKSDLKYAVLLLKTLIEEYEGYNNIKIQKLLIHVTKIIKHYEEQIEKSVTSKEDLEKKLSNDIEETNSLIKLQIPEDKTSVLDRVVQAPNHSNFVANSMIDVPSSSLLKSSVIPQPDAENQPSEAERKKIEEEHRKECKKARNKRKKDRRKERDKKNLLPEIKGDSSSDKPLQKDRDVIPIGTTEQKIVSSSNVPGSLFFHATNKAAVMQETKPQVQEAELEHDDDKDKEEAESPDQKKHGKRWCPIL